MQSEMRVLGIETSCDETGIAIFDSQNGLRAHALYSQVALHAEYGGVVPELASRDHVRKILPLIEEVLAASGMKAHELDGIAYTRGPGLIGALLVGAAVGQSLGFAWNKPTVGVHHLEGHLLAPMLEAVAPTYPFLALLVSGGHTLLVRVAQFGQYEILGESLDDAVGEAFDKTAKILGLGYPGGAALAKLAQTGRQDRFRFPRPMLDRPGLDFSFSGLKTFAANTFRSGPDSPEFRADIAAAFEQAVIETLTVKCQRALVATQYPTLVVAGGVGANLRLRESLSQLGKKLAVNVFFPRPEFCTDNGAMIAYAGCQRLLAGYQKTLSIEVNPRWSLQAI